MIDKETLSAIAELTTRLDMIEVQLAKPIGKPGSGACICQASPEQREKDCVRQSSTWAVESKGRFPISAMLDHRCPQHGEKAQPLLWGRHRDKELHVTHAQWASLGIIYPESTK